MLGRISKSHVFKIWIATVMLMMAQTSYAQDKISVEPIDPFEATHIYNSIFVKKSAEFLDLGIQPTKIIDKNGDGTVRTKSDVYSYVLGENEVILKVEYWTTTNVLDNTVESKFKNCGLLYHLVGINRRENCLIGDVNDTENQKKYVKDYVVMSNLQSAENKQVAKDIYNTLFVDFSMPVDLYFTRTISINNMKISVQYEKGGANSTKPLVGTILNSKNEKMSPRHTIVDDYKYNVAFDSQSTKFNFDPTYITNVDSRKESEKLFVSAFLEMVLLDTETD